jgi:hypothetical protein
MARANKGTSTTNGGDSVMTEHASDAGQGITGVDQQQQQNGVFFTREQSLFTLGSLLNSATQAAREQRWDLMAGYTHLCNYIGDQLGIGTGQTTSGIGDLSPPQQPQQQANAKAA